MTIFPYQEKLLQISPKDMSINSFSEENNCIVCFLPFSDQQPKTNLVKLDSYLEEKKNSTHTNCSLLIHKKCLLDWCVIDNSCPQCRYNPIFSDSIIEQHQAKSEIPTTSQTLSLNRDVAPLQHENRTSSTISCCEKIKRILRHFF
jgi:hypothetical protein